MNEADWALFRCPTCHAELLVASVSAPETEKRDNRISGALTCSQCRASFPIRDGIPRFVPNSGYADSFAFQWNRHGRTQLDRYSGLPISRKRLFSVTQWNENLTGECILEAGSGAGRFTDVLLDTGATLYSFDYSGAVVTNHANNGNRPNFRLFQCDIFHIPLRPAIFDKVLCLGVLQHTPHPSAAFHSLVRMVKPGGELVIDIYAKTFSARLQWKYVLRPITHRMDKERLHRLVSRWTPPLIPLARLCRAVGGRAGARLLPIVEYSHLGLAEEINQEWAILDTFDMYSPTHDHPQSVQTVNGWFQAAGFVDIDVRRGPNGVVGKGRKPASWAA
jgi:SAM-dependent methyltransferase